MPSKRPVVDGRKRGRRGSAWTADLFSTRGEYTSGLLYQSRLLQVQTEGSEATQRLAQLRAMRQRALATTGREEVPSVGDVTASSSDSDDESGSAGGSVIASGRNPGSRPATSASAASRTDREQRLIKSVQVEAQRDYMLAFAVPWKTPTYTNASSTRNSCPRCCA